MRAGDTILERRSGETLVVAWVEGDRLGWCGWPDGQVPIADCEVIEACSDEEHESILREVADGGGGLRAGMAWHNLVDLLERQDRFVRISPVVTTRFVRATETR